MKTTSVLNQNKIPRRYSLKIILIFQSYSSKLINRLLPDGELDQLKLSTKTQSFNYQNTFMGQGNSDSLHYC